MLSERQAVLDNVDTIAAFAEDMSDFLMTSEITESRAFIKSFVKEIKVKPGKATVFYTLPISQSTPKTAVLVGGRPEPSWRWYNLGFPVEDNSLVRCLGHSRVHPLNIQACKPFHVLLFS